MTKFFNYYNSLCVGANSPSVFSFDPYLIAIKEMLISELRQIVFYIEKLKDLDVDMSVYRDKVIEFIAILIVNLDFRRESFFTIVQDLYDNKSNLHDIYISKCTQLGIEPEKMNVLETKLENKELIIKVLNEYEQSVSDEVNKLSLNKKILYRIMINLVLNACNCLMDLKTYGFDFIEAKDEVLKLFNASNFTTADESEWIRTIRTFAKCNYKIMNTLHNKIVEKYGPVHKSNVSSCIKKGKAILVSGYNFTDLEKILEAVENFDINIYTHHEMINAFKYEKFNSNPKLVAHYQRSNNNFALDFSSFPGPIYISKNSIPKLDVIRGQIYTSAKYPAFGIGKIENNDFSEMINFTLKSKGFDETSNVNSFSIGYEQQDVELNLEKVVSKFKNNIISHISVVGLFNNFSDKNHYVSDFIDKVPDDCFVISFSYDSNKKNFWFVNPYFDFLLTYKVIEYLVQNVPEPSKNISIIFADCSVNILSQIFNVIYLGLSKIFIGPCCPNIINPIVFDGLKNLFSINEVSIAEDDIKQIMK